MYEEEFVIGVDAQIAMLFKGFGPQDFQVVTVP